MERIVLATVITNPSEDKLNRVKLQSPTLWEESELVSSACPCSKGDLVRVLLTEFGAFIIGVAKPVKEIPTGFQLVYQVVEGEKWTAVYARAAEIKIFTGDPSGLDGKGIIEVNGGSNGGVVNISAIKSMIQAVLQDLIVAQSGANLTSWMSDPTSGYAKLEDKNFKH